MVWKTYSERNECQEVKQVEVVVQARWGGGADLVPTMPGCVRLKVKGSFLSFKGVK